MRAVGHTRSQDRLTARSFRGRVGERRRVASGRYGTYDGWCGVGCQASKVTENEWQPSEISHGMVTEVVPVAKRLTSVG